MNSQEQPPQTHSNTEQPIDINVWQMIDTIGDKVIIGVELAVLSLLVMLWQKIKPALEAQKKRMLNTDREQITKLIEEIGYLSQADRVLICEFVPQETAAGGDVFRVLCTYEVTRNATQRIGFDIDERTCGGSILASFHQAKFVKRIVKDIENDRYRAYLQSLDVQAGIFSPIDLDDEFYGFIAIHYVRENPVYQVLEAKDILPIGDRIAYLLRGKNP